MGKGGHFLRSLNGQRRPVILTMSSLEGSLIKGSPSPGDGTEWPYVAGRKVVGEQENTGSRRSADFRPIIKHETVVAERWLFRLILI